MLYFISYQQFNISGGEAEKVSQTAVALNKHFMGFFENCFYDRYRHDSHFNLSLQIFFGSNT